MTGRYENPAERRRRRNLRPKVLKRDGYRCRYCGCELTQLDISERPRSPTAATIDHVVPVAKGGMTAIDNLVACCHGCNIAKADGDPPIPMETA